MADDSMPRRRTVLKMIGAATASGLAGCSGQQGDGEDGGGGGGTETEADSGTPTESKGELGERVPAFSIGFWTNFPGIAEMHENSMPSIQEALSALGVKPEPKPGNYTAVLAAGSDDKREYNAGLVTYTTTPGRLDPSYMLSNFMADQAGGYPDGNNTSYVNCEYTDLAKKSATVTPEKKRREMVNKAWEVFSPDTPSVPMTGKPAIGVVNTDNVNLKGTGVGGWTNANSMPYIKSSPKKGDSLVSARQPAFFETRNFPTIANGFALVLWDNLIGSPLVGFNEQFKRQNVLAKSLEQSNSGKTVTVELKDATFHNGDPVTAEDVKFTYNFRWANVGTHPQTQEVPNESIEIVDDKTVEFNFSRTFPVLTTRTFPTQSVLHKKSWVEAGVPDNPSGDGPDPVIGSGPFKIETFETGNLMELVPHDGHPVFSPDHRVILKPFQNSKTAFRALKQGEIDHIPGVGPSIAKRAENEMGGTVKVTSADGTMPFNFVIRNQFGLGKFRAFRLAFGKALNRKRIAQQAMLGTAAPVMHSRQLLDAHPWGTPTDNLLKYTDDPSGDVEGARKVLSEAGFGWDKDGNLHYPPDADLEPLWPKGKLPIDGDGDYPCLDEDGYVPPDER